ncbi:MAG TPA: tRNA (adenosine(37)-N6)-threonylcarbamoyltransferase complex ATPase subunit type 1 TsaE [Terriglobales bacterium]|nr:tRNA (adenosine(37)-N6)-threonylcarbamoyltransferase complex ATPase subunit type 1 TsaE [Terriglobales bacterium]
MSHRFVSDSEETTRRLAARLAAELLAGDLIGLRGSLGSGKTAFIRGLAEALGIAAGKVRSPSFTLVNEYSGGRLPLYHIDLYRLEPSASDALALREYLYGDGICAVEWFERLTEPGPALVLDLTFVAANRREIVATATGDRYDALLVRWVAAASQK